MKTEVSLRTYTTWLAARTYALIYEHPSSRHNSSANTRCPTLFVFIPGEMVEKTQ